MAKGRNLLLISIIILTLISLLTAVYSFFPKLDPEESADVKLPNSIEDVRKLGLVLSRYREQHYYTVLGGILVVFVCLQSFAVPGSIFLSILAGYLFSFQIALLVVCSCSAIGAGICYSLSLLIGRNLIISYFPERLLQWQSQIFKHREHLFNYIIFLRVTPFLPNWFINIASPIIDVPFMPFFLGTFIGVAPPSFVFIQAGTTLHNMNNTGATWSWTSILILFVFAVLSLLPVFYKNRLKSKLS